MSKKGLEVTVDELGNIRVFCHNLSSSEAIETLDYARAQVRLDLISNKEKKVVKNAISLRSYPFL